MAAVKLGFQLALSGLAVVAVFLKLLQLTFLGNTPLSDWRFAQVGARGQRGGGGSSSGDENGLGNGRSKAEEPWEDKSGM